MRKAKKKEVTALFLDKKAMQTLRKGGAVTFSTGPTYCYRVRYEKKKQERVGKV